jgi:hypothetical protein
LEEEEEEALGEIWDMACVEKARKKLVNGREGALRPRVLSD